MCRPHARGVQIPCPLRAAVTVCVSSQNAQGSDTSLHQNGSTEALRAPCRHIARELFALLMATIAQKYFGLKHYGDRASASLSQLASEA